MSELDLYEIDSLDIVYQLLVSNQKLLNLIGGKNQIYKYHIPEENREYPPLIKLFPISEIPADYADNEQLGWDCIIQIDVWDVSNAREIALEIHKLMKTIDFKQSTPTFEYDPKTYLVRDCRRYRGKIYKKLNSKN